MIIELNSLLKELQEDFLVLEKGFHAYLRKKRLIFPRLHLLSDERLLHLLSISRDPPAVNRVIRHLFPHFKMAVFNKRGEVWSVGYDKCQIEVDTVELLDGKMLKLSKAINVPVAKVRFLSELILSLETRGKMAGGTGQGDEDDSQTAYQGPLGEALLHPRPARRHPRRGDTRGRCFLPNRPYPHGGRSFATYSANCGSSPSPRYIPQLTGTGRCVEGVFNNSQIIPGRTWTTQSGAADGTDPST